MGEGGVFVLILFLEAFHGGREDEGCGGRRRRRRRRVWGLVEVWDDFLVFGHEGILKRRCGRENCDDPFAGIIVIGYHLQ